MADPDPKRPKLLVLCQLFYPELVSTGQTMTELCEVLSDMGVEIQVLCGPLTVVERDKKSPKRIEHDGIHVKRVWGTRLPKLSFLGKLVNQLTYAWSVFWNLLFDRSKRPILVLTNPPFLPVFCAFLRALNLGKPYIYLVFDVYPDTPVELGVLAEGGFLARIWDWFNRLTYKHASVIVVIGRCMKAKIESKVAPGALEGKLRVIHVWSDDQLIRAARGRENPYVERWGLGGKFVVSYSGNMGRFHDMATIMEAARILDAERDVAFLLIGEGHKKGWCRDFAVQHGLKGCQFHTYVPREDLGFSLTLGDIGLVSLAKGQEGLSVPSKAFGLLSAGVPVAALMSEEGEIARIVREEGCGVVVAQGDSQGLAQQILELRADATRLEEMSRNANRAIDEKYNLRAAAEQYFGIIESLQYD
jgi:glycosyltransferase involved in cell wall biosynthesis